MPEGRSTAAERFARFSGNDPLCPDGYGGTAGQARRFSGADFLLSPARLREDMAAFSAWIRQAVDAISETQV